MTIEQLLYLISLSKTHSFNKTAELYYISPQGLHKSLKQLETEFETSLYDSSSLGTVLTENGQILLQTAYEIVSAYAEGKKKIMDHISNQDIGRELTITCQPRIYDSILSTKINRLMERYPNIHIHLLTKISAKDIFASMRNPKINFGLCILDDDDFERLQETPPYFYTEFSKEELFCCAHKEYFTEIPSHLSDFKSNNDMIGYQYESPFQAQDFHNTSETISLAMQKHLIELNKSAGNVLNREFEQFYAADKNFVLIPYDPPFYLHFICLHKNPNLFAANEYLFIRLLKDNY